MHACQILNATKKVVFVTAEQRTLASDSVDHAIADGYNVVTVPDNITERLRGMKDIRGNPVRDLEVYQTEFAESFEDSLLFTGMNCCRTSAAFSIHMGSSPNLMIRRLAPRRVKEIRVSKKRCAPTFASTCDAAGLWEPNKQRIIIKRSQLRSLEGFAGTFST